jgi:DNA polymerase I
VVRGGEDFGGLSVCTQVHDEVIIEGPRESAEVAQQLLVDCMQKPFDGKNPLKVELLVDSNIADTWYDAK